MQVATFVRFKERKKTNNFHVLLFRILCDHDVQRAVARSLARSLVVGWGGRDDGRGCVFV